MLLVQDGLKWAGGPDIAHCGSSGIPGNIGGDLGVVGILVEPLSQLVFSVQLMFSAGSLILPVPSVIFSVN